MITGDKIIPYGYAYTPSQNNNSAPHNQTPSIEYVSANSCYTNNIMTDLTRKHCVPCEGGVDPFNAEQIKIYRGMLNLPWEVVDGKKLQHEFKFKNFKEAVGFVNRVAGLAESEGHHPDIHIYFNKVKMVLWTHAIGGLSENDFILAAKIEKK